MSARNTARATNSSRLPAMNSAFKAQSRKEQDKLKGALAEQLRQDMKSLFEEGTFADLHLLVDSEKIPAHCQFLQTRLTEFFSSVVEPVIAGREGEEKVADLSRLGVTAVNLKNLLRAVYAEDNVNPYWNAFKDAMKSHDSAEPMECEIVQANADSENMVTEQNHSAEYTSSGLGSDPSQEVDSVENQKNTKDENVVNQTKTANSISMDVCEYATLESMEPVACELKAARQQTLQIGHPKVDIKPLDQNQSAKSNPGRNSAISCSLESGKKSLKDKPVTDTKISAQNDKSVEVKPQSFNSGNQLPAASCRLGKDLLCMFAGDSAQDVVIRVDGKEIPAHRFILCARSEYFAAMLGGSWKESNSSEIELTGFSHAVVLLALKYIYGCVYELPDGAVLRELLYLTDMYGLDMFKDVVKFKLRKDYCHFFHKPCSICLERIPECLVLISGLDLSNLEECVLGWLVQYLDRAWSQKTFASLPQELLVRCREFAIQSFSPQSAIALLLQIDKLVCNLPHVSWTKAVHSSALHLQDACMQYIAVNFLDIVTEESFRSLLEGMNWKKDLIEPVFNRVVSSLTAETANSTLLALHCLQTEQADTCEQGTWNPDAVSMVRLLYSQCYSFLVGNTNLMAQARGWNKLPKDLRERIKKEGVFVESRGKVPAPKPILSSSLKGKTKTGSKASREIN